MILQATSKLLSRTSHLFQRRHHLFHHHYRLSTTASDSFPTSFKEKFVPFHKDEGGTDWYDQGRSLVCAIVPTLEDNYCFIIQCNNITKILVDPADPLTVKQSLDRLHTEVPRGLEAILTTHKHSDHTGGNFSLCQMFNGTFVGSSGQLAKDQTGQDHVVQVYGPKNDGPIPNMTHPVKGGDSFQLAGSAIVINVLDTPYHTSGHISYLVEKRGCPPALFCGDSLFVGGCGRFFEGTGKDMVRTFKKFKRLRKDTEVYCGHEYTLSNLEFALSVDPDNVRLQQKYEWAVDRRKEGLPTVPSTIGDELEYNPFMRCDAPEIQEAVGGVPDGIKKGMDTEAYVADRLREMKNSF